MPDDVDRAQEINEQHQVDSLAAHFRRGVRNTGLASIFPGPGSEVVAPEVVSATHCYDCGGLIPQGRREAVPGCRYCVSCQTQRDIHLYGRG